MSVLKPLIFGGFAIALALPMTTVNAEILGSKVSVTASTLGIGVEYSADLLETFSVRASVQGGQLDYKTKVMNSDFDAALDLFSMGIQWDVTPFGSGLYATSGVFYNMNKVKLDSQSDHAIKLDGQSYNMTVKSQSEVTFSPIAPYVGGGFKLAMLGIAEVSIEFGVLSQGVPKLNTKLTQINDAPANISDNLTIPIGVERVLINSARAAVESFTIYPVIKIAGSIKF